MSCERSVGVAVMVLAAGLAVAETPTLPARLDLASLLPENGGDGSRGFVFDGIDAGDESGSSLATADFNGDGVVDPSGRSVRGVRARLLGRRFLPRVLTR